MAAYQKSGAVAADIVDLEVFEQGDSAAVATVRWRVRSAEGNVLKDFRTSYQLLGPDLWRILRYENHDALRQEGR